jgi:hypothetical protein
MGEVRVDDTDVNDARLAEITARFEVALEVAYTAAVNAHANQEPGDIIAKGLVDAAAAVVAKMTSPVIAERLFEDAASALWDVVHPDAIVDNDLAPPPPPSADAEKKRRMRQLQKASRKANRRK